MDGSRSPHEGRLFIAVCPLLPDEQRCSCSVSSTSTDSGRVIGAAMVGHSWLTSLSVNGRTHLARCSSHTADAKPRQLRGEPTSECVRRYPRTPSASTVATSSSRSNGLL